MKTIEKSNCWVEIDLSAIKFNLQQIRKSVAKGVEIMPVLKAEAYGHGLVELAKVYQKEGIKTFGVATVNEGVKLREAGIRGLILVLYEVPKDSISKALRNDLSLSLFDLDTAEAIAKEAKRLKRQAKVHIAVDTGMTWYGLGANEVVGFVKNIAEYHNFHMEGIYSHCSLNTNDSFVRKQITLLSRAIEELEKNGVIFEYKHIAKSSAVFRLKESHFNMVRPGITLYGIYPKGVNKSHVKLKPALSFKTSVFQVRNIPPNTPVSYEGTFKTSRNSKLAILPIGYSDGLSRLLSNKGKVIVRGKKAPIIGNICMNIIIIDITDIPNVSVGDIVTIIGKDGKSSITISDQAKLQKTISYEILTGIRESVQRIYAP